MTASSVRPTEPTTHTALEPLLTVSDVERLLGVNRRTVRRLCKKGKLPPPLKVGQQLRWKPEEIAAALEGMRGPVGRG
jgi:excisionase family DNA binding protein